MLQTIKMCLLASFFIGSLQGYAQNNDVPTNRLKGYDEELELHYVVWGCSCPNWVTLNDFEMYQDNRLVDHCMYLEQAADSLVLPDDFDPSADVLKVKGQYYVQKGYPKGFVITKEDEKEATVFRVSTYSVEKGKKQKDSGLVFSFTAKNLDDNVETACKVVNTTNHDIYFLTSSCAGYQEATIYSKDQFDMLMMLCNASHPVVVKIEPQKSYSFRILLMKKGDTKEVKLGFEMKLVDQSLYDTKITWEESRKMEGDKIVLWNTSPIVQ